MGSGAKVGADIAQMKQVATPLSCLQRQYILARSINERQAGTSTQIDVAVLCCEEPHHVSYRCLGNYLGSNPLDRKRQREREERASSSTNAL